MYHLMSPFGDRRTVHSVFAPSIDEAKHIASIRFGVNKNQVWCHVRSRTPISDLVLDYFERSNKKG